MALAMMADVPAIGQINGYSSHSGKSTFTASVVELGSHDDDTVGATVGHFEKADTKGSLEAPAPAQQCPMAGTKIYTEASKEFDRIRTAHRTLAPTG